MAEFHAFELAGWSDAATVSAYDGGFGSVTIQAVPALPDTLELNTGSRLLDVATGPGHVAAAAAERGAQVAGIDFSPAMVETALANHPQIEFRQGDAQALPYQDSSFDAVVCSFGMHHFAEPEAAISEASRVLTRDGRFAFSVWAQPDEDTGMGILRGAIAAHGNLDVPLPEGPPQFRFADPEACRGVLESAGFSHISTSVVELVWKAASAEALFNSIMRSSVRMRGLLLAQGAETMPAIKAAFADSLERYRVDGGIALPMPVLIVAARKP